LSNALATDPFRFLQTGYIPLSYEDVSETHEKEYNFSASTSQISNTKIDALYFTAKTVINISTVNFSVKIDTGGIKTETPIIQKESYDLSVETRHKSAQFELGLYNGIPGASAFVSVHRGDIVQNITLGQSGLEAEIDMFYGIGALGLGAKLNPFTGGLGYEEAVGGGGGIELLFKKK
jgi:hypothetical protein